jgi:hypothetical protein
MRPPRKRLWILLPLLGVQSTSGLRADPAQSVALYPVLVLSGRATDPEHIVNPHEAEPVPTSFSPSDAVGVPVDEFATQDPVAEEVGGTGTGPFGTQEFSPASLSDFEDTLIRTEQETWVRTFVGSDSQRLPESWAVPPGSSVADGGHPGSRYSSPGLDYSGGPGVSYYPPPVVDAPYRGSQYSYPYQAGYSPAGPYSYRYDGMQPMGDPRWFEDGNYQFDSDFSIFTRQFNPEQAHLKAGPFFFQAVWLEVGGLYSDYTGPIVFQPGQEDGWLSYASFAFQMTARLNPSLYMTAQGEIIYLFGDNELGFRSGFGGGPFASIVYEWEQGPWDFRAFAEFGTGSFNNMFGSDAFEFAGRYSFGFFGIQDTGLLFDPFLYTRIGVSASTLTSPDWRLTLSADHTDFWIMSDAPGDDHWAREHFGVRYAAEPGKIPFNPWFSYDLISDDFFDSTFNTFFVGGSGRLSKNVEFNGQAGYLFNTRDLVSNGFLWTIGLRHRINERTTHGVWFGQNLFMNDFSIDSTVSSFFQYDFQHQITDRLRFDAYVQWSTDDFLSGQLAGGSFESEIYGLWLHYQLSERTTSSVGYLEEQRHDLRSNLDFQRSVLQARLETRIGFQTNVYFLYQHEDTDFSHEDLYMAGIRRYF